MDLETNISLLIEAQGCFTTLTLDSDKKLEAMLVYLGKEDKKWTAKVKVKNSDNYITKIGLSNSHSKEAIKKALLSATLEIKDE